MKKLALLLSIALLCAAACQTPKKTAVNSASPTQATPEPTPDAPASSRQTVWDLGSSLSLAALGYARNAPEASVTAMRQEAQTLAQGAGLKIADFPAKKGEPDEDSAALLQYLLTGPGAELAAQIKEKYDTEHAALFDTAVKSNILILLYAPNGELNETAAEGITKAARLGKLPEKYWQPALDKVKANAPATEISAEVRKMQEEISDYLATVK